MPRPKALAIGFMATLAACAFQRPVFHDAGDHEGGIEIPCAANVDGSGSVKGWHRCHEPDPQGKIGENGVFNCCGDNYSCGEDDFVPSSEHVCRLQVNGRRRGGD